MLLAFSHPAQRQALSPPFASSSLPAELRPSGLPLTPPPRPRSRSLALSVAGIFKEICTIITAVLAMPSENKLTGLNLAGLGLSILGIAYDSTVLRLLACLCHECATMIVPVAQCARTPQQRGNGRNNRCLGPAQGRACHCCLLHSRAKRRCCSLRCTVCMRGSTGCRYYNYIKLSGGTATAGHGASAAGRNGGPSYKRLAGGAEEMEMREVSPGH